MYRRYEPYFSFPDLGPAAHRFGKLLAAADHVIVTGATVTTNGSYLWSAARIDP